MNIILAISMNTGIIYSICIKFEKHIGESLEFHLKTMI